MKFFDIDSPLYKYLTLVFDIILIGLLWLVTSLPVVTMGVSAAAAYYVMIRRVSDLECSIIKDYFKAFKDNIKHATGLWLIILLFAAVNIFNFFYGQRSGVPGMLMNAFHILFAAELLFIFIHAFPLMSRFNTSFLQMVRTALLLAHKHLITTLTHVVLLAAIILFILQISALMLIAAFGLYCWLSSLMLVRIYRKYEPDFDKDATGEDG